LCGEAAGEKILIAQRGYAEVEALVVSTLRGFRRRVISYRVRNLKTPRH